MEEAVQYTLSREQEPSDSKPEGLTPGKGKSPEHCYEYLHLGEPHGTLDWGSGRTR